MEVKNFTVNKNVISWELNDGKISIAIDWLKNAYLYSKGKTILVLVGQVDFPSSLLGYSVDGKKKFEVAAPEGFVFSYITAHPEVGVCVVCGGKEKIDGWYDWHFAIDVKIGKLTRHCPAY
ncbi:MAG: hypothetical protein GX383_07095 [Clostridium sp.]|nr:hypothetical protein [Clostridium sp.]